MRERLLLAISQSVTTHGAKVIATISADRGSLMTYNRIHPAQKTFMNPKPASLRDKWHDIEPENPSYLSLLFDKVLANVLPKIIKICICFALLMNSTWHLFHIFLLVRCLDTDMRWGTYLRG